jgi:hypothetical protein
MAIFGQPISNHQPGDARTDDNVIVCATILRRLVAPGQVGCGWDAKKEAC